MNDHKKEETMLPDWMCSGENRKSIKIEMEILERKTTEKKFWKVYAEQKRAMEQMSQELAQKKALIDQMESSKAWKVYHAIKRV